VSERERLFDWCVGEIQSGRLTFEQCLQRYGSADPELADLLATARLSSVVPIPEVPAAQARVRARLMTALAGPPDQGSTGAELAEPIPLRSPATRMGAAGPAHRPAGLARIAALAAAVLLSCGLLGWGTGTATAASLPGDPLYGLKRGEEWLALATAFSDQRRGEVLALIADHRLTEAVAESDRGQAAQARSLASEFDQDLQQVIVLSATMAARHEDNGPVLAALARELVRAQQAQARASDHGQATFAQALSAALSDDVQALQSRHLKLPDDDGGPRSPHGQPTPAHPDHTPGPGGHGKSGLAEPTANPGGHGGNSAASQ
jgi:hypothetical protein